MELFGSSETCGPQTTSLPGTGTKCGSVGLRYPQFECEIADPDEEGVGEIVTRGRHMCLGYIWEEEKTRQLIDEDGWVHSGDLGYFDDLSLIHI